MAVVWIGSIRHARMPQAVRYVANPVKTAYSHKKGEDAAMTANIAYALNPEKGTARLFQTALHLKSVESAWTEMRATKERWGKTEGIQGFHIVQSFKPGEVTPELAHRIGIELVERCFDGFEAVIGTHLDKQHIHNHIILNSVSFLDGHKYHSTQKSYYTALRKASDELCRKYGLSVVEPHAQGPKSRSYSEWLAGQRGQKTWCSAIREDVDAAVSQSRNFDEFVAILRADGYAVKTEGKYLAVRPPGKERFTRLRRLGNGYTEEALRARILDSRENTAPEVPIGQMTQSSPRARHGRYAGRFGSPTRPKVRGLRALYLWYAYRMGNIRTNRSSARKTHYLLREDIRKLQKRDRMATLLVKNKIETFEQLSAHRDACQRALSLLCALREKERRGQCETPSQTREKIKALRRELRLCEEIRTDSLLLQKKREALRELARQKQRTKQRRKARHAPERT